MPAGACLSLATIFDLLAHHDRQDRSVEEQRIGAMVVTSDTMFSNESAALGRAAPDMQCR